jgi:hypothetical protein
MGFLSGLVGAQNQYQATQNFDPAQLQQSNYGNAVNQILGSQPSNVRPDASVVDLSQSNNAQQGQQALEKMLLNQAQGNGPSVAQNQLNQATQRNIANTQSQLGSVRGMNPAQTARLVLQNAATQNQNVAGDAATLRAQEQLGAMGGLGNVLGQERQQNIGQALGATQAGIETIGANTARDVAGTQRLGTLGGLQNAQNQANIENTLGTQRNNLAGQSINAGIAGQNARTNAGIAGGILGSLGSVMGLGSVGGGGGGGGASSTNAMIGASGGAPVPFKEGGEVPGKAKVDGDSGKNDTVPAMLSPGEIVVPRSKSKDPEMAKEFIDALQRAKSKKDGPSGYSKVLQAHDDLHNRLSRLEKMAYGGMAR